MIPLQFIKNHFFTSGTLFVEQINQLKYPLVFFFCTFALLAFLRNEYLVKYFIY